MKVLHINANCERALINLNDKICAFERGSGREYTFILIPHQSEEEVVISQSGKPISGMYERGSSTISPEEALNLAMGARGLTQAEMAMRRTRELLDDDG